MRYIGAAVIGLAVAAGGVALGSLTLAGVEPAGHPYINCGPAVFGRPDPPPHPDCTSAYAPLPAATWALIAIGASMLWFNLSAAYRGRPEHS